MKEHLVKAATLLPWWVNLILAEVSFVALYLLDCFYGQFIVPALFIGASMIATAENERQRQEERRKVLEKQDDENMLVTKVILKDLMKGRYREIHQRTGIRREEQERPDFSKYMIIGLIGVTGIISTVIMIEVIGKGFKEGVEIANPPAKNTAEYIPKKKPAPVRHVQQKKNYSRKQIFPVKMDFCRKKPLKPGEKLIGYTIIFNDNDEISCENLLRMRQGALTLLGKKLNVEFSDRVIREIKRESELDGWHNVNFFKPEDF